MQCHIHGGQQVSRELLVEHHKHPTGYGGAPDDPNNIIFICASCHTILHKMEAAFYAKNIGKANDLANQYLPNDPRRRTILIALANQAASAKRQHYENHPNDVPEDPDEVEERLIIVQLEMEESLHHCLKVKASDFKHPQSGKKVGLYRYILEVLRAHVDEEQKLSRKEPTVPNGWDIT